MSPTFKRKFASRRAVGNGTSSVHCDFKVTATVAVVEDWASCASVERRSAFNSGSGSAPGIGASSSRGRKTECTPQACRPVWTRSCARKSSQTNQILAAPSSCWTNAMRNGCAASPTPRNSAGGLSRRERRRSISSCAATLGASATRRKRRLLPSPSVPDGGRESSAAPVLSAD